MSGQSEDAEFDEIDLKDLLLKTLRENGTLKCIQGQLTAAIYAAFYEQKNNTSVPTPSSVSSCLSTLNGITAVSLVVDLLETLKLKHSLQVFVHEANLASVHLKNRKNLYSDLGSPVNFPDSMPLLLSLISQVGSEEKKSAQIESIDRIAGSGDKLSIKETESPSKVAPVKNSLDTIDTRQDVVKEIRDSPSDTDSHSQSACTDYKSKSKLQSGNVLDNSVYQSTNRHENALSSTSHPIENTVSIPPTDAKEVNYEFAEKSEKNSESTKLLASSRQSDLNQTPVEIDGENKYSDESFSTGSDNSAKNSKVWLDEAIDDGAPSVDENDLSESIHRLELVSPDNSTKQEHTLTSSSDAKTNYLTSQKKATDNSDHLFKATPGKSLDHRETNIPATVDGDSDIDSETTDFTMNSSRTEGCDYMEPVQPLI